MRPEPFLQLWRFAEGLNAFQLASSSVSFPSGEGKPSKPALLCGNLCAFRYARTEVRHFFFFFWHYKSCHDVVQKECINILQGQHKSLLPRKMVQMK